MGRHPTASVWTPTDLRLRADRRHERPHSVDVTATFEHESGTTHEVPGFWDGGGEWRVRFAPTRPGNWSYEVAADADDPGLADDGQFVAADYEGPNPLRRHGFLRTEGRRLVHDDGTPFVWLADTAWAAGAKATPAEWDRYLTARRDQGFDVVQVNALPQHDASRPWDRLPFGEEWDLDDSDPEYFRALDGLVAAVHDRGMVPALVAVWFNYAPGTWPDWDEDERRHPMDEAQAARLGRYLGARYGAYGAVWLVSGDTDHEADDDAALAVYDAAGEALGESLTHPLRTTHMVGGQSTPEAVADREWVDFHLYQSSHVSDLERPPAMAEACRSVDVAPVINGEPPYERHAFFDRDESRVSRETARAAAWLSVLAGATAGVTYGAHGVWPWHRDGEHFAGVDHAGVPDPWHEALSYPGARDYGRLRAFLERYDAGALTPRQDLLVDGPPHVRVAELPAEDLLFAYAADADDLVLDAVGTAAEWIDPADWRSVEATVDGSDDRARVAAPPWDGDALLRCRR